MITISGKLLLNGPALSRGTLNFSIYLVPGEKCRGPDYLLDLTLFKAGHPHNQFYLTHITSGKTGNQKASLGISYTIP